MRSIIAALGLLILVGCGAPKAEDPTSDAKNTPAASTTTAPTTGGGSTGGVTPMAGGAATGMSPMSGTESVEGAGMGGIGQVAKDKARQAAAGASTPAPAPEDGQ